MATRFYFPASTAADVSPLYEVTWDGAADASRRKMTTIKGSSPITIGSLVTTPPFTVNGYLDRQYVSGRIAGNQTISGTVKMQLMVSEEANNDNLDVSVMTIRIFSADALTERGVLLGLGSYGPANTEFAVNPTYRNETFADGDALVPVNALHGDRIVVEMGYALVTTGTTPQGSAKYGEDAADLPEDETQTTNGAGWIEFSQTIAMIPDLAGRLPLLGVGA